MKAKITIIDASGFILIALFFIGLFSFLAVRPYYEAKTFNKYRSEDQPEATYWDAVFSELRVETKEE